MAATDDAIPKRFFYGAKTAQRVGNLIERGHSAEAGESDPTSYIYLTDTVDAAAWQAELAPGDGPGIVYRVEPLGPIDDDPDPAGKMYPAPAKSFRTCDPIRVTGACTDRQGRPRRLYHGTKADLKLGDVISPGRSPNFGDLERTTTWIYFTGTLDAAIWGAELALGDGRGRIYVGPIVDDRNLTNKRFPGNPTKSYRSRDALRIAGEVADWQGHPPEVLQAMRDGIEKTKRQGLGPIDD